MHARHADVKAKVSLVEADYEPEHCHVFEWESGLRRMHDALWDNSNEANPFRHNWLWQSYIWALVLLMGWNMLRASTAGEHVRTPLPCPALLSHLLRKVRGWVRGSHLSPPFGVLRDGA